MDDHRAEVLKRLAANDALRKEERDKKRLEEKSLIFTLSIHAPNSILEMGLIQMNQPMRFWQRFQKKYET